MINMSQAKKIGQHLSDTEQLDTMQKLAISEQTTPIPKVGDLVRGKVISVSKNLVRLDIEGLTTGVVRGPELEDESGQYDDINIGDEVEATLIQLENEQGEMELSFLHAGHQKAWNRLEDLLNEGAIVQAKIINANKGGLMARVGNVAGFLPVSQLTTEHYPRVEGGDKNKILEKLNQLVNKSLDVKVIDVNEIEEKLIISEKAAWEEKQKEVLAKYTVGTAIEGTVTGVVDFGAFVEFDEGLEGLVHISELAWQRIDDPHDIIKVGDKVKAEIIGVEGSKISLSIKKLQEDPWTKAAEKYQIGDMVTGRVLKANPFGLFVELDDDIHGLAHISELADTPVEDPTTIAKPGDELEFRIISIESEKHRLGLSLRKASANDMPETKQAAKTDAVEKESPSEKPNKGKELERDEESEENISTEESGTSE